MRKDCLKAHQGSPLHNDWLPGFRWVPRSWTSYCRGRFSKPPKYLFGNLNTLGDWGSSFRFLSKEEILEYPCTDAGSVGAAIEQYPKPIPRIRKWYFSWPLYFAWTFRLFKWKILFRLGFRYTEVTNEKGEIDGNLSYYSFPVGPSIRSLDNV